MTASTCCIWEPQAVAVELVVNDLPRQFGVKLFQGVNGLAGEDFSAGHCVTPIQVPAPKLGLIRSYRLWRLLHNTANQCT
ncbi:MAG TPA: hypothetical protein VNR11_17300 [Xanthobacteraceae bacterium]|nr:hypothetical protein [Xanthobacteraceae bacterium]